MANSSKEVFDKRHIPLQWKGEGIDLEKYKAVLTNILPNPEITDQMRGGTGTISFILRSSDQLYVCQFAPPKSSQKISSLEEKSNPNKFDNARKRMEYLREQGVSVPVIISEGEIEVEGENRHYILMSFVEGVNAERFLASHLQERLNIYYQFGRTSARLHAIPFNEECILSATNLVLTKVKYAAKYITKKGIMTGEQQDKLMVLVRDRLLSLGDIPITYVHLDPSPTNLRLDKEESGYKLILMDIEAIKGGHPIIEGIGRTIMTGIYDWNYITEGDPNDIDSILTAFVDGYLLNTPYGKELIRSKSGLEWLMTTCRLVHLPQSIMYELKKDTNFFKADKESFEWSVETLEKLLESSEV